MGVEKYSTPAKLEETQSVKKVLLTGFEPFGGSDINSSWETVVRVGQLSPKGVVVETMQLPVSFKRAGEAIREALREKHLDVLVMLGQRGNGTSIEIERIAINLMDSTNPDNDGCQPQEQAIVKGGENATGVVLSIVNGQQTTEIYDLTGRKVLNVENLKGGVYIVNGRKVVVK